MSDIPQRSFVPQELDCSDFSQLQPLYQQLLDRPIGSADELKRWLLDFSELASVVSEFGSRRAIDHSCHTDDPEVEKAYMHWVENVSPKIKPVFFELQKKYLDSGYADQLEDSKYKMLTREWKVDVGIFRPENVELQTQVTKTTNEYDKLCGAMILDFRGEQYTLQQLARFLEDPDRETRKEAWQTISDRRFQDREAMDDIFDRLLPLRDKIASNADLPDYRAYLWKAFSRFDYTPDDCHRFADAIEAKCMPLVKKLNEQRREQLGLERLRPWDMNVDPKNRPALEPFASDKPEEMVAGCQRIFEHMSSKLGEQYATLKPGRNLDLGSRKGKRPGGYQSSLEESREPFIFMNAAGLHRDVETMLHEAGHAFHYMAVKQEPLMFVRHAPIEFCEVASMSMELLGLPYMTEFYDDSDAARASRAQFEGNIRLLPWIATIDQFQHWLYTNSGHTQEQRTEAWLAILDRFSDPAIDWL